MRRWGGFIVAAMALGVAGCADLPRDKSQTRLVGELTWDRAIGLSQDEIRAAVGLRQVGTIVAGGGIRLDNGHAIFETSSSELLVGQGACGSAAPLRRRRYDLRSFARLKFVDGRLASAMGPETSAPVGPFAVYCVEEAIPDSDLEGIVWLPALPFFIGSIKARRTRQDAQWKLFEELRMGAEPPGGLDAWVATHADLVTVEANPDGGVVASVKIEEDGGAIDANKAVLRDGVVIALAPVWLATCRLKADLSLKCAWAR